MGRVRHDTADRTGGQENGVGSFVERPGERGLRIAQVEFRAAGPEGFADTFVLQAPNKSGAEHPPMPGDPDTFADNIIRNSIRFCSTHKPLLLHCGANCWLKPSVRACRYRLQLVRGRTSRTEPVLCSTSHCMARCFEVVMDEMPQGTIGVSELR